MNKSKEKKIVDFNQIRSEFPILEKKINNNKMVYLDSAASAQKPMKVIETLNKAYLETYSNVHRGLHWLSEQSTSKYEEMNYEYYYG